MQFLLLYRSLTYAQRAVRVLEKEHIPASVVRTPRTLNSRGCGYCAAVSGKNGPAAAAVMDRWELRPEKIFRHEDDGSIQEAPL